MSCLTSCFSEEYPYVTGLVLKEYNEEVQEPPSEMAEDTLQRIWHSETFDHAALKTVDGTVVEILSPGFWNPGPGPDFMSAEIGFNGGPPVSGNVEVELVPSGWRAHGHSDDLAYDDVVLLAVLRSNTPMKNRPRTSSGKLVPVLVMDNHLVGTDHESNPIPSPHRATRVPPSPGLCSTQIKSMGPEPLGRLLDMAGDWRMRVKTARFEDVASDGGVEEALYRHILRYLGGQAWKQLFGLVGRRLPLDLLRRIRNGGSGYSVLRLQAALIGAAGLIPDEVSEVDGEARAYWSRIRALWGEVRDEIHDPWIPPTEKRIPPVRPANRPLRRLAAAGYILDRLLGGEFLDFITSPDTEDSGIRGAEDLFLVGKDDFWASRCDWQGNTWSASQGLVGKALARTLAINALLPAMLELSRLIARPAIEEQAFTIFSKFPALERNRLDRFMEGRFFGDEALQWKVFPRARRQQGVYELCGDWCEGNPNCRGCPVPGVLRRV